MDSHQLCGQRTLYNNIRGWRWLPPILAVIRKRWRTSAAAVRQSHGVLYAQRRASINPSNAAFEFDDSRSEHMNRGDVRVIKLTCNRLTTDAN